MDVIENNRIDPARARFERSTREELHPKPFDRRRDEYAHDTNRKEGNWVKSHDSTRYTTKRLNSKERPKEQRRNSRESSRQLVSKRSKVENKPFLESRYDKDSPNRREKDSNASSATFTRPEKNYRGGRR